MNTVTMILGDVRDVLDRLIADGVTADFAVTSPPFLALRSYLPQDHPEKHRELGSEPTPAAFLDGCYGWTAQLGQLIPEWGSIAVELGDTMSGSGGGGGDYLPGGLRDGQPGFGGSAERQREGNAAHWRQKNAWQPRLRQHNLYAGTNPDKGFHGGGTAREATLAPGGPGWPLAKSMCLIPHAYTIGLAYGYNPLRRPMTAAQFCEMVECLVDSGVPLADAFNTVQDGIRVDATSQPFDPWRIRNVITWARPNPPVGSLGKRNPHKRTGDQKFRQACSFITIACRGAGRYFDLDAVRTDDARAPSVQAPSPKALELQANGTHGVGMPATGTYHANGGAPPLDWHTDDLDGDWLWKLATAPYKGAHYATFPLTLPRRLIQAMCPERVCTECHWPSERIAETANSVGHAVGRTAWTRDSATSALMHSGPITMDANHASVPDVAERVTTGWTDCGHDAWRPGRVIDIFGGSGTTAVAAALEQRDAILIDLDRRNVDLVRRRLTDELRIVNEHHDGDTITWTVETRAPHQNEQCDGQTTLLDLLDTEGVA